MNISVSNKSKSQDVKSKYFTGRSAMDESLSDFQEPKKSTAGPKSGGSKSSKPKKPPKRIRGQKDIRAALRSKKNELESYSEDFDKVCKKAGIDVDPEQLQLAIALSKSLQETASTLQETEPRPINTQERIGKIRTTLQEYGFKVPNVKIVANTRRVKKHKKSYKLILTSETEKKEIIADKYSQVLFQNIAHTSLYYSEVNTSDIHLFYLASNAPYSILKSTDTFYVNNLIEKSTSTGNLLKDWSDIPGRPVSPKLFEQSNMNFSEIECSQDEIDIVLSGSLKRCKNVFNIKKHLCIKEADLLKGSDDISIENILVPNVSVIDYDKTLNEAVNRIENMKGKVDRSSSPDLFEDDESSIFDNNKNSSLQTELNPSDRTNKADLYMQDENAKDKNILNSICDKPTLVNNSTRRKSNDLMELTECFQIEPENSLNKLRYQLSQNITKRRSNDLMEITECVTTYMHPQNNIDLTQDPYINKEYWAEENTNQNLDEANSNLDKSKQKACTKNQETNSPNTSQKNYENATSTDENNKPANENLGNSIESMDLTQSSNTSDELPFVSLTDAKDNSLDDTIIVNYDNTDINKRINLQKPVEHIDLTQNSRIESHSQSFFDEYVHDHSDNKDDHKNNSSQTNNETDIDLTQSRTKKKSSTTSSHSNSQRKSPRNVENPSNSQSKRTNTSSQDNSPSKYYEEHVPVELHRSNGYKYPKPDKVDLTQSPKRNVAFVNKEQNCNVNSIRGGIFYSQSSKSQNMSTESEENNSPTIKANNLPAAVELNVSNSGIELCKPDQIDLTQTPVIKFTCNIPNEGADKQSRYLLSQRQDGKITSNKSSDTRQSNNCPNFNDEQLNCSTVNLSISPIKHGNDCFNKIQDEDDIDLTQSSDSSVELTQVILKENSTQIVENNGDADGNIPSDNNLITPVKSQRYSSLGKKDDISIDYDDFINRNKDVHSKNNYSVSNHDVAEENVGKLSRNNSFISNCSQNSEVFEISDKELDYSLHRSKLEIPTDNFVFGGISIMDEFSNFGASKKSGDFDNDFATKDEEIDILSTNTNTKNKCKEMSPIKHRRITEIATPLMPSSNTVTVVTPKNSELVIKTNNITPILDYQSLSTPEIHTELDKFGIKPFKRKRGKVNLQHAEMLTIQVITTIQLLTHIYNQTHPIIEHLDELASPPKRHKPNLPSPKKLISPRKLLRSPTKDPKEQNHTNKEKFDEKNVITINKGKRALNKANGRKGKKKNRQSQNIEDATEKDCTQSKVMTDIPILRDIECKPEDWVFQKREKAKVHSCRVPLHIAFYNYVSSRRDLREAILCYEPVEIDIIHKDLVAFGHRYDPMDLLRFLDKKCITVKTTDNDGRNQKR